MEKVGEERETCGPATSQILGPPGTGFSLNRLPYCIFPVFHIFGSWMSIKWAFFNHDRSVANKYTVTEFCRLKFDVQVFLVIYFRIYKDV